MSSIVATMNRQSVIVQVAYEINKAFCESLGDFSNKPWLEVSEEVLKSNSMLVAVVLKHPEITPEDIHNVWSLSRLTSGWTLGEEKDTIKKTHPSLKDFKDLSETERAKDFIFKQVVLSIDNLMETGHD